MSTEDHFALFHKEKRCISEHFPKCIPQFYRESTDIEKYRTMHVSACSKRLQELFPGCPIQPTDGENCGIIYKPIFTVGISIQNKNDNIKEI